MVAVSVSKTDKHKAQFLRSRSLGSFCVSSGSSGMAFTGRFFHAAALEAEGASLRGGLLKFLTWRHTLTKMQHLICCGVSIHKHLVLQILLLQEGILPSSLTTFFLPFPVSGNYQFVSGNTNPCNTVVFNLYF